MLKCQMAHVNLGRQLASHFERQYLSITVAECLLISSTTFTQYAPEATEFGEITQNKDHYAVQGHSRSVILVPIKSSYTTSY